MTKLHIDYIPLETLQRAYRNPKDHDIGELGQSIDRFKFVSPVIINEGTGRLVAGHGRLDTLQQMKASGRKPPGYVVKQGDSWLVPVVRGVEFKDEAEAEAYMLADNRLTELGGWHEDQLAQVLSDLAAQGEEMLSGVGWDADDVDKMLTRMGIEGAEPVRLEENFNILVECESEQEQTRLLERFNQEGIKCRALIS